MKHIKTEQYEIVCKASELAKKLYVGNRNQLENFHYHKKYLISCIRSKDVPVEKLPKQYTIIISRNENIGTNQWPCVIEMIDTVCCNKTDKFPPKWTDKSLVTYNSYGGVARVIPRGKIIAVIY